MKKLFIAIACLSAVMLMGMDLSPRSFSGSVEGKARLVAGEKLFSAALQLDATDYKSEITAVYKHKLPYIAGRKYEFSGEIKGRGTAFLEIVLVGVSGKSYSWRVATQTATPEYRDIEGELDFRRKTLPELPHFIQLKIGIAPGSDITFYDLELEMEK